MLGQDSVFTNWYNSTEFRAWETRRTHLVYILIEPLGWAEQSDLFLELSHFRQIFDRTDALAVVTGADHDHTVHFFADLDYNLHGRSRY